MAMTRKQRRITLVGIGLGVLALAVGVLAASADASGSSGCDRVAAGGDKEPTAPLPTPMNTATTLDKRRCLRHRWRCRG